MEKEPIRFSMAYLTAIIKEAGYTLETFAKALNMSDISLSRRLRGETSWTQQDIYLAAKALNINDWETLKLAFFSTKKFEN